MELTLRSKFGEEGVNYPKELSATNGVDKLRAFNRAVHAASSLEEMRANVQ